PLFPGQILGPIRLGGPYSASLSRRPLTQIAILWHCIFRKGGGKPAENATAEARVAELHERLARLPTVRKPFKTARRNVARWIEPVLQTRIVHRGGRTAERVRRAGLEGRVEAAAPKVHTLPASLPAVVPAENIQRLLPDAVVPSRA